MILNSAPVECDEPVVAEEEDLEDIWKDWIDEGGEG